MNIVNLQTFLSIVETGSLVRASEQLNVTQSTVTARLKSLEEALGSQLLNRDKSGVSLTPAGAKLMRYAQIMTGLWRQARRETALPEGLAALCTLGCHADLWDDAGRRAVTLLTHDRPELALTILGGSDGELERGLSEGLLDMVLTHRFRLRGGLSARELPPEEIALYGTRPGMAHKGNADYVFVDHGEEYRKGHGETYFDANTARVEFSSSTWAIGYLMDRGGQAYLPRALAAGPLSEGRLHAVPDAPVFQRRRYLVWRDASARNWGWFDRYVADLAHALT